MSILKKLPASESGPQKHCFTKSGQEYLITCDKAREKFTLWKVTGAGYEKLNTAKSPLDFDEQIPYDT